MSVAWRAMTTSGVHVDTIGRAVRVEVIAKGCTRGLSVELSPTAALELQGSLAKAILKAEGRAAA